MTRRQRHGRRAAGIGAAAYRLRALYAQTTAATRAAGAGWYPAAYREACAILPADPVRGAAIIAALSPQVGWRENLRAAARIAADPYVAGEPNVPGYMANRMKAAAIADGAPLTGHPGDALGGQAPKVRAFWRAICGDLEAVTLDIWAMRAAYPGAAMRPPAGDAYRRGVLAYRAAARRLQVAPRDLQAILWVHVRGIEKHHADAMAAAQLSLLEHGAYGALPEGGT
jgi:hypothetical protein